MKLYDYIILGGGASGLMMAYRMANDSFFDDKQILILDKEQKAKNDRTWCFWETPNGIWDDILTTSWNSIEFKSNIYSAKENIAPYQYKMLRSTDFYQKIWNVLNLKTNFLFIREEVKYIQEEKEIVKIIASKSEYFSKTVLNSIVFSDAYQKQTKYPVLQQHFVGFFVKTKADYFDDTTATFMDFTVAQKENTRFMYILPYSKNEALFEYTLFSSNLLPYDEYKIEIEKYLEEKNIIDYNIIDIEQGSIPMTCYKFWKHNSKNIIHIGTAGGWTKASTGFTFKNSTKKSKQLISYLKKKKSLKTFHKKNKFWLYDLLLIDILHEKNYIGSTIFGQMFKNNSAKKILKFLDEDTSLLEDLQIQLKMPPYQFVRALLKRIFN